MGGGVQRPQWGAVKVANRGGRLATTERWFVHRGMPQAIVDYSATEDVFTRMSPFLAFVVVAELFLAFGDRFQGWIQAVVFAAALAIVAAGVVVVNRIRHRPDFALPDDIETPELVLFCLAPAVVATAFGSEGALEGATVVGVNLMLLGVGYLVTKFGLVPMLWWGVVQFVHQVRQLVHLLARGLPLLLLFSAFIFLNAEMWQVAHEFTPAFYVIIVAGVFGIAIVFLALRLPDERDHLSRFSSWREICDLAESSDAPYGNDQLPDLPDPPHPDPLTKADRANVVLLLMASQTVQLVLVSLAIGVFYVVFGLFTVREDTLLQWTTIEADTFDPIATLGVFGDDVVLTWELLAVAGFISAFSGLQFAVSALTDQVYRDDFFSEIGNNVREVLAVRALYRAEYQEGIDIADTG